MPSPMHRLTLDDFEFEDKSGFRILEFVTNSWHDDAQIRRFNAPFTKVEEELRPMIWHNRCPLNVFSRKRDRSALGTKCTVKSKELHCKPGRHLRFKIFAQEERLLGPVNRLCYVASLIQQLAVLKFVRNPIACSIENHNTESVNRFHIIQGNGYRRDTVFLVYDGAGISEDGRLRVKLRNNLHRLKGRASQDCRQE